jgi:FERM central domain
MLLSFSSSSLDVNWSVLLIASFPFCLHRDPRILELLYEEARHNVLLGRYIMEPAHSIMLGGIQARIELGPYNVHTHTVSYFR